MNHSTYLWGAAALALLASYLLSGMIIRAAIRLNIGTDETSGVQKFHTHRVSRLGGVPIFIAIMLGLLGLALARPEYKVLGAFLIVSLLPVFGIGLLEDITRSIGAGIRLLVAMGAAVLACWLFKAGLFRIGWSPVDAYLSSSLILGILATMMATSGAAHGVNIIDGCNGLSGFFIMAALAAIALIAASVGNNFVLYVALLALAATAGFFLWNFPSGRIFLGDAGAYMLGFLIAQLCLLLITYHPQVSPWCPMLIMAYPAWETLFSMYRRGRHGARQMGRPDARHLHQLIYRRILKWAPSSASQYVRSFRNALTSVLLWPMILLCMVPAVLYWDQDRLLFALCWMFALTYTLIYLAIVRFKVPAVLTRFIVLLKEVFEPPAQRVSQPTVKQRT